MVPPVDLPPRRTVIAPFGGCPGQNYLTMALAREFEGQGCKVAIAPRRAVSNAGVMNFPLPWLPFFQGGLPEALDAWPGARVICVEAERGGIPAWCRSLGAGEVWDVPMADMIREGVLPPAYWSSLDGVIRLCRIPELEEFLGRMPVRRIVDLDLDIGGLLDLPRASTTTRKGDILSLCPVEGCGGKKGSDLVARAAMAYREAGGRLRWDVTCRNPVPELLEARSSGAIEILPVTSREELLERMASRVTVVVQLERAGGYGMALREARAMGIPTIAGDWAPFSRHATIRLPAVSSRPGPFGLMPWRDVDPVAAARALLRLEEADQEPCGSPCACALEPPHGAPGAS